MTDERGCPIPGSKWRHAEGGLYVVIDGNVIGKRDEAGEWMKGVVYLAYQRVRQPIAATGQRYWRSLVNFLNRFTPEEDAKDDG